VPKRHYESSQGSKQLKHKDVELIYFPFNKCEKHTQSVSKNAMLKEQQIIKLCSLAETLFWSSQPPYSYLGVGKLGLLNPAVVTISLEFVVETDVSAPPLFCFEFCI